jgi:ribosome-associated protein
VLLDFFDVIVHIFSKEAREFYGLERLWGDAPKIGVSDD